MMEPLTPTEAAWQQAAAAALRVSNRHHQRVQRILWRRVPVNRAALAADLDELRAAVRVLEEAICWQEGTVP